MPTPHDALPPAVMARLTTAEARLYPMAMTDPEGYERGVRLVGLVAAELRRRSTDLSSVLECRDELVAALPELAAANGLQLGAIPADVVVDAASALRCWELQAPP